MAGSQSKCNETTSDNDSADMKGTIFSGYPLLRNGAGGKGKSKLTAMVNEHKQRV